MSVPKCRFEVRYPSGVDQAGVTTIGRLRAVAVLLTLGLLSACSSSKPGPTQRAFFTPEPSAAVTLSYDTAAKLIGFHLQGNGLVPKAAYQLQLRRSTCLKPGSLVATSKTIASDAAGAVNERENADHPTSGIPKGTHIELRLLVRGSTFPESISSACTDVPARTPTTSLRLFPPPTLRAGGSYVATFKDARTLSLVINIVGAKPGKHEIRISRGSCEAQGPLDTSLGDLNIKAGGSATLTKVIHVTSSTGSLYVGVSFGPTRLVDAASPIDSQIILCGDLPSRPAK
jgi:hypothetical protein